VTTRLYGTGSRCIIISPTILNLVIWRYRMTDYFLHSQHLYLMIFNTTNSKFILLQPILPLCDYKVWIDTERGEEAISYPCSMTQPLTLPFVMRWSMSRTRKSKRRRGHGSVRKHIVQSKLLLEVVNNHSLRASDHILLRTDRLFSFVRETSH
jgi:hypothetical protein